ncbi:MAG: ATPase [Bacteroidales bacterium]
MILIADSGSTKTEWREVNESVAGKSYTSSGFSPFFLKSEGILELLKTEMAEVGNLPVHQVHFYGTGCSTPSKEAIIRDALKRFFLTADLFVESDLLGAARSLCMNDPGIACIIGTGSNSCYYDGRKIASNVASLGYILGDEGSGAVIGRKLITGVLKKQLPQSVIEKFFNSCPYTPAEILDNVYNMPFPNRYLGQFVKFIDENKEIPELKLILVSSFEEFISRNILQYPEAKKFPVHFTGRIAFHFRPLLMDLLIKHDLKPGKFSYSPMEDLVNYHIQNLQKNQ